jgi:hypothetical protein
MAPSGDQLGPRSCVLETLTWSPDAPAASLGYVIVDDFAQAIAFCRSRLAQDLIAPIAPIAPEGRDEAEDRAVLERWRRARAIFVPGELERRWRAAEQALAELGAEANADAPNTAALSERLRAVTQQYALDLEVDAIYALPDDLAALLAVIGNPFVWWDDEVQSVEQERAPFDYANARHRDILARRLREQNEAETPG